MNRYFLKVNGDVHCPNSITQPQSASEWEGGTVLIPNETPRWVGGGRKDPAPMLERGDALWIWTHEHEKFGFGAGLTATASVGDITENGEFYNVVLKDVALIERPFNFRKIGEQKTGSRLLDYVNAHRHHHAYYIEDDDYADFMAVIKKLTAPMPQEANQHYTSDIDQALKEHKQSILDGLKNRRLAAIKPRSGQQAFRASLIKLYNGRCVITGCNVPEALEAAHVIPHTGDAIWDRPENGLLLRRDLHALFDAMMWTIHPESGHIKISSKLRGTPYAKYNGKAVDHKVDKKLVTLHFRQFEKANSDG